MRRMVLLTGMMRLMAVAVCLITGAASSVAAEGRRAATFTGPVSAEVIRVLDGDTIEVEAFIWPGHHLGTLIRLDGINAPELRGKCDAERALAIVARNYVQHLMSQIGPDIQILNIRHDKYGGRMLASVQLSNGDDLGHRMLAAGLARPYDGKRRQSWCAVISARTPGAPSSSP